MRMQWDNVRKYYPPDRYDGTRLFYDWIGKYINSGAVVLNLGAGEFARPAEDGFRGRVGRLIGADIDSAVLRNPGLDEVYVIKEGKLPLADSSVDIAFSDYVFEHVEHPYQFLSEAQRVLRDGGSFFFRTPNRFHYDCLIARATPHFLHEAASGLVHGAHDVKVFRTFYRLNSRKAIGRTATKAGFSSVMLRMVECEPSYLMFNRILFFFGLAYERLVNGFDALEGLRANIFGRLVK